MVHFNGDLNTGLTLRTIRIKDGIAEVRAGATLLYDSIAQEEEAETELKASAMISAIRDARAGNSGSIERSTARVGEGVNILLVDHEDSFVHTLANYFRQTGANVSTVRTPVPDEVFDRLKPDLVVLSPGPGTPKDFDCAATIKRARKRDLPIFGVCLGLQALAEAYGGELRQLHIPDARQAVAHPRLQARRDLLRPAQGDHRRPLPFDLRRSGPAARRFRGDGGDRGRRHHGLRAPQGADRGRAVPSRNRS